MRLFVVTLLWVIEHRFDFIPDGSTPGFAELVLVISVIIAICQDIKELRAGHDKE